MSKKEIQIYKNCLAIDVGAKSWGYCFKDEAGEESGWQETKSFYEFYKQAGGLITLWKPDILAVGKPNRFYSIISSHSKYIGILCLLCEKAKVPLIEINDTTARATLYPKEGTKKGAMGKYFPNIQQDQADAIIMARAWIKLNK